MTITVTTVSNSQTFGAWLQVTNRLANLMSTNAVTADSSTTGSLTTGNVAVNGSFGASYVYVGSGLVGGNLASNSQLLILSNTAFRDLNSANQVTITSNSTITTVTLQSNTVNISPTSNTTVSGQLLTVSSNVSITSANVSLKKVNYNSISEASSTSNSFLSTSPVTLDSFDKTVYRSAEYLIQCSYSGVHSMSKIHLIHDGTSAYSTEYGVISSNGTPLASFASSISSANARITITPSVAPLDVKFTRLITLV
jgi:small nuclear ribonucleoprotein (snRNP)-like protein